MKYPINLRRLPALFLLIALTMAGCIYPTGTAWAAKGDKPKLEAGSDGLSFSSANGHFKLGLSGRVHYDAAFHQEDIRSLEDDSDLRRARVAIKMTLYKKWRIKSQFELSGSEVEAKDQYLRYTPSKQTSYTVGQFKESFSLEELTSSNNITFVERSLPVATFAPGRQLGFAVRRSGKRSSMTFGIFDGPLMLEGSVAEADKGQSTVVRGTFAPLADKTKFVHIGLAYGTREFRDGVEPRFRARPESALTSTRLVNTGRLEGVEDLTRIGLEFAAGGGPFQFQSELIATRLNRPSFATNDPELSGWYAQVSWVLGGQARSYNPRQGTLGGISPDRRSAWELALRASSIDLDDQGVEGGEETNFTLGLNWYLGRNVRLMANYILVNSERRGVKDEPKIFLLRAQVAF